MSGVFDEAVGGGRYFEFPSNEVSWLKSIYLHQHPERLSGGQAALLKGHVTAGFQKQME